MVSGAVVHSLPAGATFDLVEPAARRLPRGAPGPPDQRPPPGGRRMTSAEPDLSDPSTRVYRGPNIWSYEPAIHLVVDLGSLEDFPTDTLPGFTDGLLELLPGLARHTCSRGRRGGFLERLKEGTWLGHVAEHVALQLQQEAGHDIRRGKTRRSPACAGSYNVIYGYVDEQVGAGGRAARGPPGQPPGPGRARASTSPPSSRRFLLPAPSAPRSARRPRRSSTRRSSRDIPWHPAQPALPGAARPGRPPAAHPGHHDLATPRRSPSTSPATRT